MNKMGVFNKLARPLKGLAGLLGVVAGLAAFFFMVMPSVATASPMHSACHAYPALKGGMHLAAFRQCQQFITSKTCRWTGPIPDATCMAAIKAHSHCAQTNLLLTHIPWASIKTLRPIKIQHSKLSLIQATAIADGALTYFIITPQGCLINTAEDPRKLSPALRYQYPDYKERTLMAIVTSLPEGTKNPGKTETIHVGSALTACRACRPVISGKVEFHFSRAGVFLGANWK